MLSIKNFFKNSKELIKTRANYKIGGLDDLELIREGMKLENIKNGDFWTGQKVDYERLMYGDNDPIKLNHIVELYSILECKKNLLVFPDAYHFLLINKGNIVSPMIIDFLAR